MCFVYIRQAKRKGAGLQTRTHADIHKRSVIHSASQTHTCSYNVASEPRRIGGPTRHLLPAKWTTCFDGSPVQSRRWLTNKSNKSSSLRLRIARNDALLSASSSGHSLLSNNLSQSGNKQTNNKTLSLNKRGIASNVKFAATHRVITRRKSSVIFRPLVFKCLPRSRPLRTGSTSVGE